MSTLLLNPIDINLPKIVPSAHNSCTYFHSDCDFTCPHTILELIRVVNLFTTGYNVIPDFPFTMKS